MGDTPAPASKPKDSAQSSSRALPESQTKLNRAMSTAPPTDEIDSEWPSDDEPAAESPVGTVTAAEVSAGAPVSAHASAADDADWQQSTDAASSLMAPTFPSDPGLPRDLRSPSGIPSSRPLPSAEAAEQSRRDMDTVPAAPQASRPPNSSGPNSNRHRSSSGDLRATAVVEPSRSQASAVAVVPSEPTVAAAQPRFESSPPRVVSLPAEAPASRREPHADARHSFDPHVHLSHPAEAKKPSRAPLLFALVASAAAAFLLMRGGGSSSPPAPQSATQAAQPDSPRAKAPSAAQPTLEPSPAAAEPAAARSEEASNAAPPSPVPSAPAPAASAAPSPADAAAAPVSAGNISVLIRVRPPQARIFYRGKEVGKAPVTVEIEPGKRRAYEVSLPGFMTRKVIVDGSETELSVGLRPDPSASPAK